MRLQIGYRVTTGLLSNLSCAARLCACLIADLAVIKVDGVPSQQLRPLPLGTSESGRLRVGQLCLAIGNRKQLNGATANSHSKTPALHLPASGQDTPAGCVHELIEGLRLLPDIVA